MASRRESSERRIAHNAPLAHRYLTSISRCLERRDVRAIRDSAARVRGAGAPRTSNAVRSSQVLPIMTSFKLTYFNVKVRQGASMFCGARETDPPQGLGEVSRVIFALAGQAYEDDRCV